jgi:hypothetical protein
MHPEDRRLDCGRGEPVETTVEGAGRQVELGGWSLPVEGSGPALITRLPAHPL